MQSKQQVMMSRGHEDNSSYIVHTLYLPSTFRSKTNKPRTRLDLVSASRRVRQPVFATATVNQFSLLTRRLTAVSVLLSGNNFTVLFENEFSVFTTYARFLGNDENSILSFSFYI